MKKIKFLAIGLLTFTAACNKDLLVPAGTTNELVITTTDVNTITQTTALSGIQISGGYGPNIIDKGVCWGNAANPTINNSKTSGGTGVGFVSLPLTSLKAATSYYTRAYVITNTETLYGGQLQFNTLSYQLATISTANVSGVTQNAAMSGGTVSTAGGGTVSAKGVCWSTISNPTIQNNKTIDGTGLGNFTSALTSLTPNTLYYVRAYATNEAGTTYGQQTSFLTSSISLPTLSTVVVSAITRVSATVTGTVVSDGGGVVSNRGICWSTNNNPTIGNGVAYYTGSGLGSVSAPLTGLITGTTYYVRIFATNLAGTSYGIVSSFRTL